MKIAQDGSTGSGSLSSTEPPARRKGAAVNRMERAAPAYPPYSLARTIPTVEANAVSVRMRASVASIWKFPSGKWFCCVADRAYFCAVQQKFGYQIPYAAIMRLEHMTVPIPTPRTAATLILLRDGASGLETLMIECHTGLSFAPGALVFPGGCLSQDDHARGGDAGLALHRTAIRECFEECGILLAHGLDG